VSEDFPIYGGTRIAVPATCPECGEPVVMNFTAGYLRKCLDSGAPIELRASCHNKKWDASATEVQQIRRLLEQWENEGGKVA
jgi:hypothetical protein